MKKLFLILSMCLLLSACSTDLSIKNENESEKIEKIEGQSNKIDANNTTTADIIKEVDNLEVNESKGASETISNIKLNPVKNTPEDTAQNIEIVKPGKTSNDSTLYKEALLKQVDSASYSYGVLIDYIDVLYEFADVTAPSILNSYRDAIAPLQYGFSDSVEQLITSHLNILDAVKASFKTKANSLSSTKVITEQLLNENQRLRETVVNDGSINAEEYIQIGNKLETDSTKQLTDGRNALSHLFTIMTQDIKNQETAIKTSLDAINEALGSSSAHITTYSTPHYPAPSFNITRCFTSGGGYTPLVINCAGSSF